MKYYLTELEKEDVRSLLEIKQFKIMPQNIRFPFAISIIKPLDFIIVNNKTISIVRKIDDLSYILEHSKNYQYNSEYGYLFFEKIMIFNRIDEIISNIENRFTIIEFQENNKK